MSETSTVEITPAARPFTLLGGDISILIIHGYGGSIADYRSLAELLNQAGFTVRGLCLPGHGRTLETLRGSTLTEWQATVYHEAMELRRRCRQTFVLGSSFGAVLALHLAALAPKSCDGLVVVNTALRYRGGGWIQPLLLGLLKIVTPYYKKPGLSSAERAHAATIGSMSAWPIDGILATSRFARRVVQPALPSIRTPILILSSASDPIVGAQNSAHIAGSIGSKYIRTATLDYGGHRPFRDPAATAQIATLMTDFIRSTVAK